jgi:low temperature requirement protein LtrA
MTMTAVEQEHRVTPRELFFDLVFVFAFTQVVMLLANDPTFAGIGHGVLVLAALRSDTRSSYHRSTASARAPP